MDIKKNIIRTGLMGLLLTTTVSCSDFLNIEPLNEIVQDKFWNSESDVENIVAGCYSGLQSQAVVERMMAWGEFRSDNITGGTNYQNNESLANLLKENITAKNEYARWESVYDIINRCNIVLEYAPMVAQKDPNFTESELKATQAEMSAMRDLCYFYLIRAFRNVPFSTTAFTSDTQEMALPATPFNTILDSLIIDLEKVRPFAVSKYPESKPLYQKIRITQQAINAMLCEMYLWKKDYANCIKYADLIIDEKKKDYEEKSKNPSFNELKLYNGYPLITDEGWTYKGVASQSIFGSAGCSWESIFELYYDQDETMLKNGAVSYYYGNSTTFPGIVKPADYITTDVSNEQFTVYVNKYDTRNYTNHEKASSSVYGIAKYADQSLQVMVTSADIASNGGLCMPRVTAMPTG